MNPVYEIVRNMKGSIMRDYEWNDPKFQYEGDMKNGVPHGFGIIYDKQGKVLFEGTWKDGKRHGHGKESSTISYDWVYEGDYVNDRMHGKGKLTRSNGELIYEGDLQYDVYHGKGVRGLMGHRYEGLFENGSPVECCKVYDDKTNELIYAGRVKHYEFNGDGIYYTKTKKYIGTFENGKLVKTDKIVDISNDAISVSDEELSIIPEKQVIQSEEDDQPIATRLRKRKCEVNAPKVMKKPNVIHE